MMYVKPMNCPSCAFVNPTGAKFCLNCGTRLEAAPLPEGERRVVTVLFADVAGSTTIGEMIDPEQVAEIMHGAFSRFNAAVDRFGGTVTRLMGDGVLAIFGAPIAHEDDPERAVHAGLAILQATRSYAEGVRLAYGVDFQVRVGVHTGRAVLAMVGDQIKTEYTAMGDTANVAARLQTAAEPGTLLISGETYYLVRNLFDTRFIGPQELKGRAHPVDAYEVLGAKPSREKVRGLEGLSSPVVGREREEALLRERASRAASGRGSVVALVGEAGLGKSRLVAELRRWVTARPQPAVWLEGRALSYGQTIAYYPWRQIIRQALSIREVDPPAVQREQLRAGVPLSDLPLFERLLSIEGEETGDSLEEMRGDELRSRIATAIRAFLQARLSDGPLVLVFDDLHWADEPTLDLLASTAGLVEGAGLLVLCVLRPDARARSWGLLARLRTGVTEHFDEIDLEPLDASSSRLLLGNLLEIEDLPESVREVILAKSDGNPFFIEEVIRSLIDAGRIVREGDHWRATSDIVDAAIPDTLTGVLSARIDRLPEETKRVVQTAAVIGRIFEYPVLTETFVIAPPPEQIEDAAPHVETLTAEGLVRERARDPELEYIFKHALTQEAAYELLLLRRRKTYHRRVGEALERVHSNQLDDLAPILAFHAWESEDWERCARYAVRAAASSVKVYAIREAMEHYERAYEALTRLEHPPAAELVDAVLGWVEFARRLNTYEEVMERLTRVEPLARELGDARRLAQILNWMGNVHVSAGFPTRAMPALMESYRLAEELGDERLVLLPLFQMSGDMVNRDPRGSLVPLSHVIELTEKFNRPDVAAHALATRGLAYARLGEFSNAMREVRKAHEMLRYNDVPVKFADVHIVTSQVMMELGDIERSLEHSRMGTELAIEVGAGDCSLYGVYCSAMGNLRKPDPSGAEAIVQRQTGRIYNLRSEYLQYLIEGQLAVARSMEDDPAALGRLKAVLAHARALGDEYSAGILNHALAECLMRQGDLQGAEAYLESALAYYRKTSMKPYLAPVLRTLERLRSAQGRDEDAAAAGEEARRLSLELAEAVANLDLQVGAAVPA